MWRIGLICLFIAGYLQFANAAIYKHAKPGKIKSFACPIIDASSIITTPSDCSGSDGSITGLTVLGTGAVTYTWYTAENDKVGTSVDLLNVPPGTYTLSVKDESKCLATTMKFIVGQANPVVIDDSAVRIAPSDCSGLTGAITNIKISNATQYQWTDVYKNVVGTTADLEKLTSGVYTLAASNANGCNSTATYTVPSSAVFPKIIKIDTTDGVCNSYAGGFTIVVDPPNNNMAYNYNFVDNSGQVIYGLVRRSPGVWVSGALSGILSYSPDGPDTIMANVISPNQVYTLIVSDNNNCSTILGKYSLPPEAFTILTNNPSFLVRNDACGRHTGGIFNLKVAGGTKPERYFGTPPNQVWTWTDSLGNVLSHTPNLILVGKGTYTLIVQDYNGCAASAQFTIKDSTAEAFPPTLSSTNVTLCLPGTVNITVVDPNPKYKYRLYDSSQTAITQNDYGIFQIRVNQTSTYSISTIDNQCESSGTPLKVTVVAPGVIIPNTFTPNNDGINDHWAIPHIDDFPGADVAVYNRDGQLIFHSVNYSRPFDGNYNGKQLPGGVYYYTIDLKQPECFGKITGSLTLIR